MTTTTAEALPAKPQSKRRPRLVWLLVLAFTIIGAWVLYVELPNYAHPLEYIDAVLVWIGAPFVASAIGALILQSRPGHRMGWLLMLLAGAVVIPDWLDKLFLPAILAASTLSPAQAAYAIFSSYAWWPIMASVLFIFLLYPTGEYLTPRWRRVGFLILVTFIFDFVIYMLAPTLQVGGAEAEVQNPFGVFTPKQMDSFLPIYATLLIASALLSVASVFVRYRRAKDQERSQMRWLFFAGVFFFSIFFINLALGFEENPLMNVIFAVGFLGIPSAIGIGILRYRTWDIDIVINRSIVYALLTTFMAAIFAAVAGISGQFAKSLFGEDMSQAAAAVAAVVAASLFQPLKAALEKSINRRMFPENIDLSLGLGELNPELWQYLGLPEVLNAALDHLQDIYKFDKAAIYLKDSNDALTPIAAYGVPLSRVAIDELSSAEHANFREKKAVPSPNLDFAISVPLYWQRRKSPLILGALRLGKRAENRAYSAAETKALQTFGGKLGQPIYALQTRPSKPAR
jgi:hypothetical protein